MPVTLGSGLPNDTLKKKPTTGTYTGTLGAGGPTYGGFSNSIPDDYNTWLDRASSLFPQSQTPQTPLSTLPSDFASTLNAINAANRAAQQAANASRIPNASGLENLSSGNIGNALSGIVPGDIAQKLQQQAAERGIATGMGNSPNANSAYLRALGLTSLDMTNKGQEWLGAAYARNPGAPIYDPTHLILTPYQQEQIKLGRSDLDLKRQGLMEDFLSKFLMTPAQRAEMDLKAQEMSNQYGLGTRGLDLKSQELANELALGNRGLDLQEKKISNDSRNAMFPNNVGGYNPSFGNYGGRGSGIDWTSLINSGRGYVPPMGLGSGVFSSSTIPMYDTSYNPVTDSSIYDPWAGTGSSWYDYGTLPPNTGYDAGTDTNFYDPFAGMDGWGGF